MSALGVKWKMLISVFVMIPILILSAVYMLIRFDENSKNVDLMQKNIEISNSLHQLDLILAEHKSIMLYMDKEKQRKAMQFKFVEDQVSIVNTVNEIKKKNKNYALYSNLILKYTDEWEKSFSDNSNSDVGDSIRKIETELENLNNKLKSDNEYLRIENEKMLKKLIVEMVSIFMILLISNSLITLFITNNITKRLSTVSKTMKEISKGNLDIDMVKVGPKDEIGEVNISLNEMILQFNILLNEVGRVSSKLYNSTTILNEMTSETTDSSRKISEEISALTQGNEEHTDKMKTNLLLLEEVEKNIDHILSSITTLNTSSQQLHDWVEENVLDINLKMKEMENVEHQAFQTKEEFILLNKTFNNMNTVVSVINQISQKTNLLSLNASIEAARAGEFGKGFAVVADEVRNLANHTRIHANEVKRMIDELEETMKRISVNMETTYRSVIDGKNISEKAASQYIEMSKKVKTWKNETNQIHSNIEGIHQSSKQMVRYLEESEKIAQQLTNGHQVVASATQQQIATMETLQDWNKELLELGKDLESGMNKFQRKK